jgi:hypothetical protein
MKRLITQPLIVLAAILMFLEEVLWEALKKITGWIGKLPVFKQIEAWIIGLPPYPMMLVFVLPSVFLFPVKLGALWLIANGHAVMGICTIIIAKIVGTAFVARFFVLCKPKLLTIGWFRAIHDWVVRTRDRLYAHVRSYRLYWQVKARLHAIRITVRRAMQSLFASGGKKGAFMRRWMAIRRWRQRKRRARMAA